MNTDSESEGARAPIIHECEYPECKCPRYGRCGNAKMDDELTAFNCQTCERECDGPTGSYECPVQLRTRCRFCGRTLNAHSHDTRDICNFFVPNDDFYGAVPVVQREPGRTGQAGMAPCDD